MRFTIICVDKECFLIERNLSQMETHYNSPNAAVRKRLRRARGDLAITQSLERENGVPLVEDQPASEHLKAALDMLFDGLRTGDMEFIAFGVCMVQDVEL